MLTVERTFLPITLGCSVNFSSNPSPLVVSPNERPDSFLSGGQASRNWTVITPIPPRCLRAEAAP